jgi:hypothetical protein
LRELGILFRISGSTAMLWGWLSMGFEKMHATPEMVTSTLRLYFTVESLRNIEKFLKLQGVKVTHVSIYNWIPGLVYSTIFLTYCHNLHK